MQAVSLFAAPKELLSDQGKEFLNCVDEQLVKAVGMESKVTCAYDPRTNGLVERFNQTLIQRLGRHAQINGKDWRENRMKETRKQRRCLNEPSK